MSEHHHDHHHEHHDEAEEIVENALIHGCEPSRSGMQIDITAVSDGSGLVITVRDNGIGIDAQRLEELNAAIAFGGADAGASAEGSASAEGGVGLSNIAQRLHLRFGEDAVLAINSVPQEGTTVTIRIPQTNREEA